MRAHNKPITNCYTIHIIHSKNHCVVLSTKDQHRIGVKKQQTRCNPTKICVACTQFFFICSIAEVGRVIEINFIKHHAVPGGFNIVREQQPC